MTDLIKHNQDVYNRIAPLFSATREHNWADVEVLTQYTKPGDQVLDLGCGNGRLYQILAKKQVLYTGMDQSEGLIALAKEKAPEASFVVGEMSVLPFADASFGAIFCIAALNHIPGQPMQLSCLKEMHRVLKPGGHLLMTNWNLHSDSAQKNITKHGWNIRTDITDSAGIDVMVPWKSPQAEVLGERYYHGFTEAELSQLLTGTDFTIVDQYYSSKGQRVSVAEGGNLVTIAIRN